MFIIISIILHADYVCDQGVSKIHHKKGGGNRQLKIFIISINIRFQLDNEN